QQLKHIIAALDADDETFRHLVENAPFNILGNTEVDGAVFPQPNLTAMNTVDQDAWKTVIDTIERLEQRIDAINRYGSHYHIIMLKEKYVGCFNALCYLEVKNELPLHFNLEAKDVYEILHRKEQEHIKSNTKTTADQLFALMEKQSSGFTLS